jgi:transposase-like protein
MNPKKGRGRRRGREERARLAQEYVKGGQSVAQFARSVGVLEPTVARWLKESGPAMGSQPAQSVRRQLVPVTMGPEPSSAAHVEIAFADGTALRAPVGIDPGQLEALLAAVRRSC